MVDSRETRVILILGLVLVFCLIGNVQGAACEIAPGIHGDHYQMEGTQEMYFSNYSSVPMIPAAFESVSVTEVRAWKDQFIDPVATQYYQSFHESFHDKVVQWKLSRK